jgi:hypothetical protein
MKKIAVLVAIFGAIISAQAQAIEGRGAISPARADETRGGPPDFHKVMDFYETGRRIRVYTLPIEEQRRYAATGTLWCHGRDWGSAQVTRQPDVLTSAGHNFIDPKTCMKRADVSDCSFIVEAAGEVASYQLQTVEDGLTANCRSSDRGDDWAVIKLTNNVQGVTPYMVSEDRIKGLRFAGKLTFVAHSNDFFDLDTTGEKIIGHPKFQIDCAFLSIYPDGLIGTSCGSGSGASGGSCLDGTDQSSLVGVIVASSQSFADEAKVIQSLSAPDINRYDPMKWATQCRPILGNFLKALNKTAPVGADPVLAILPRDRASSEVQLVLGLQLTALTDSLRQRYKIDDQIKGVVVTTSNSQTSFGFLNPGDVIFEFAGQHVTSPGDLRSKVEQLKRQGVSSGLILARAPDGHVRTISIRLD